MSTTAEQQTTVETAREAPRATTAPVQSMALATQEESPSNSISAFASQSNFEAAQRMAKALSSSSIVPAAYAGNIPNCLVAMELAGRTRASVMMVMQNLHVIQGRPSWSSVFLIASVNSCGAFSRIRYQRRGGDDPSAPSYAVRAVATELATGEVLEGEWITWDMVKAEKWLDKPGSKWKTMPGQMFRYRAASFWTRAYAPEISIGMHTTDEAEDMGERYAASRPVGDLNAALRGAQTAEARIVDASPSTDAAYEITLCDECGCANGSHADGCSKLGGQ